MAKLNMQHNDLDSNWSKGLQLKANEQIQTSSINDVEISWAKANLLVENFTMSSPPSVENALE